VVEKEGEINGSFLVIPAGLLIISLLLLDKKLWFSGEPTKPETCGYRKGSDEEARTAKLKQTMNRVVSAVAEGPTVSKGLKNEFKQATEAAKGSAGKTEFLEKHVQKQQQDLEKMRQEKDKQQHDMEEMKRWPRDHWPFLYSSN